MSDEVIQTASGRTLDELTIDAICKGELKSKDFHISSETLRHQADAAEAVGYYQFGENLRRAAELANVSNDELLDIYNALRPGRSTHYDLAVLADHLESDLNAPLTAEFVREASEVYEERGLSKKATTPSTC